MDPITSGLTILQVVQTIAQVSAILYEYAASIQNADPSCQSLLDEFRSINGKEPVGGYVAVSVRFLTLGTVKDGTFEWLKAAGEGERVGKSIYLFRVPPLIAASWTHAQSALHFRHAPGSHQAFPGTAAHAQPAR